MLAWPPYYSSNLLSITAPASPFFCGILLPYCRIAVLPYCRIAYCRIAVENIYLVFWLLKLLRLPAAPTCWWS